jgi:hypothetical protein
MRATKGKLIAVNATGCLEVFSTPFPETSWQIAWLHSLFGNAPAVASGVAAALQAMGRTDIRVVGQGGDGRVSLRSDRDGPGADLGGTDPPPGDTGRDDPDEQLPLTGQPGVDAYLDG